MVRPSKEEVMREKMKRSTVDVRKTAKEKSHSSSEDETCVLDKGGERSNKEKLMRAKMMQIMRAKMKRNSVDARKTEANEKSLSRCGAETSVVMDKVVEVPVERTSKEMKRSSVDARKTEAKAKSQSRSGVGDRLSKEKVMLAKMNRCSVDARKSAAKAKSQSRRGDGVAMMKLSKEKVMPPKMNHCNVDAKKTAARAKPHTSSGGGNPMSSKEMVMQGKMKNSTVDARKTAAKAKMKNSTVDARKTAAKAKSQTRIGGGHPLEKSSKEKVMPEKMKRSTVDARKKTLKGKAKAKPHSLSGGANPMMKSMSKEQVMREKMKRNTVDDRKTVAKGNAKSHSRNGGGDPTVKPSKEQVMPAKMKCSTVDARKTAAKAKVKSHSGSGGKLRCRSSEDSCSVNVVKEDLISGFKIEKSNTSGPECPEFNMIDVKDAVCGVNLGKRSVSEEYGCKKCLQCNCTRKSPAGNVVRPESTDPLGISSPGSPPQIHNISSDSDSGNEELAREDDESEFVTVSSSSSKDCEDSESSDEEDDHSSSDDDFYPYKSSKSSRSKKSGRGKVFDRKKKKVVEESEHSESSDDEDDHSSSDDDFYPNKSSKSFCSEKSGPSQEIEMEENEDESEHSESANEMDEDDSEHSDSAHEKDESEHSKSTHENDEDESEHSESTHDKEEDDSSSDGDFHPNISSNDLGKKNINRKKEKVKVDIRNDAERFKGGRMKRLPELNNHVPTKMAERLRSSQTKKRKNSDREPCVITLDDDDDDEQEGGASSCQDGENDIEKTNPQEKEEHEEKGNDSKDNEQSDSSSNDNKEDDWKLKHQMPWKKRLVGKILVDSLWDQVDLFSSPCHEQEPFALSKNFSLEDYDAKPAEEKSYWDIEGDKLFEEMYQEMDFENATDKIGSTPSNIVGNDQTPVNNYGGAGMLRNCGHGKHVLVLDEQIGLLCKVCSYVEMEIRYVPPTFVDNPWKRTSNKEFREKRNNIDMDQLSQMDFENGRISHPNEDIVDTPGTVWGLIPGMRPTMYSHQRDGFEFIWSNLEGSIHLDVLKKETSDGGNGCIISHAPGTGKTRLTIMFIKSYLELYPTRKVVIIAPCNMLLTWEEEFKKWKVNIPFHNLNKQDFSGQEANAAVNLIRHFREQNKDSNRLVKLLSWKKDMSVLGMSYRLFEKLAGDDGKKKDLQDQIDHLKLKDMLQKLPDLLVLDEGHTPRNKKSLIWKALSGVETQKRIILSGTPFQNNFSELYNTLCLVRPKFADKFFVEKEHALSGKQNKALNKWVSLTKGVEENNDDRIDEMRNIIYRMAHVYKGDILKEKLPGLRDSLVVLKPTELQNTILDIILKMKNGLTREHCLSLTTVHPSLLIHSELKEKQQLSVYMAQLEALKLNPEVGVKTKFIIELIRLSESLNEKVLIFSQYIPPLALIKDQLKSYFGWSEGNEMLCMDGGKDTKMRQLSITSFNKSDNTVKVMLASTKACSEGISLVGASRVVLLDVVWNPSVERQAISRAYRLGQKKLVYIYHLVAGEAETTKYGRQTQKDRLSKLVFSSSNDNNADTSEKILMGTIGEDKILQVMVQHEKTCLMFEKIINLEKESNLIDADDVFGCATSD